MIYTCKRRRERKHSPVYGSISNWDSEVLKKDIPETFFLRLGEMHRKIDETHMKLGSPSANTGLDMKSGAAV
jgi:hypothetical protein